MRGRGPRHIMRGRGARHIMLALNVNLKGRQSLQILYVL